MVVPDERFAKRQFVDQPFAAQAAAIEPCGCRGAKRQFMRGEVVEVGMGDESPRLALARVHSEVEVEDPQAVIVKEHGKPGRMLPGACPRDRISGRNRGQGAEPWSDSGRSIVVDVRFPIVVSRRAGIERSRRDRPKA